MSMFTDCPRTFTACTPSDATDVSGCYGIYVGGAGDVAVKGLGQATAVTLVGVAAGTIIPGRFSRIMSTNTTATDIVLLG